MHSLHTVFSTLDSISPLKIQPISVRVDKEDGQTSGIESAQLAATLIHPRT